MIRDSSIKAGSGKIRVAVFNTHPIQYYAPLWRKLATFPELELKVFYGSDFSVRGYHDEEFGEHILWDTPLLDGYNSEFLAGFEKVNSIKFSSPHPLPAIRALLAWRPDVVVITAYHSAFWYAIAVTSWAIGARVVMRHDATDEAFASRGIRKWVRRGILQLLYNSISHFAVVGNRARRHLQKFGVRESRMTWSPFCVDSDWVNSQKEVWKPQRARIRSQMGIEENAIALLFCGKLINQKDPLILFEAIRLIREHLRKSIHLVIVGSGPLSEQMMKQGRNELGNKFHPLGFLNQNELGRAYALSDILILPSRSETWGLVVNEALQFGLPVVLATGVGSHEDLVPDDLTGRVFQSGNAIELAKCLESLVGDLPSNRDIYCKSCNKLVSQYSLAVAADGLREAIISSQR